jgi:hypothetical protein
MPATYNKTTHLGSRSRGAIAAPAGRPPEEGVPVGRLPGGEPRRTSARAEVAGVGDGIPEAEYRVVALRKRTERRDGEEEENGHDGPEFQHC